MSFPWFLSRPVLVAISTVLGMTIGYVISRARFSPLTADALAAFAGLFVSVGAVFVPRTIWFISHEAIFAISFGIAESVLSVMPALVAFLLFHFGLNRPWASAYPMLVAHRAALIGGTAALIGALLCSPEPVLPSARPPSELQEK